MIKTDRIIDNFGLFLYIRSRWWPN